VTRILVALFNIQGGCLRQGGGYDFRRLQVGASAVDQPPTVWLINEAKRWRENANVGLHGAAEALSDELGVPYVGVLGISRRGPIPPAIIYNPTALALRSWWNPDDPNSATTRSTWRVSPSETARWVAVTARSSSLGSTTGIPTAGRSAGKKRPGWPATAARPTFPSSEVPT
jgi:hypothetical protein